MSSSLLSSYLTLDDVTLYSGSSGTIATIGDVPSIGGTPTSNVPRRLRVFNDTGPTSSTCSIGDMMLYMSKSTKSSKAFSASGTWAGYSAYDYSGGRYQGEYFSGSTTISWDSTASAQGLCYAVAIRVS